MEFTQLTAGANIIAGICFLVAAYFLKDFVSAVRSFMWDCNERLTRIETHLEIKPEDVGSFIPRRKPTRFHRRDGYDE